MSAKEQQLLDKRIGDFWNRKIREFPELDSDACTDYENYHISDKPKFFRETKDLIKHY